MFTMSEYLGARNRTPLPCFITRCLGEWPSFPEVGIRCTYGRAERDRKAALLHSTAGREGLIEWINLNFPCRSRVSDFPELEGAASLKEHANLRYLVKCHVCGFSMTATETRVHFVQVKRIPTEVITDAGAKGSLSN